MFNTKEINSAENGGWVPMPKPLVIDSGAAETVLPDTWFQNYPIIEGPEMKAEQSYVCADGTEIQNVGERHLVLSSLDWTQTRKMKFQVTQVHKALGSVSRIIKNNNKIVFDEEEGSYILNKETGEKLWLREDNGVFVLDVLVAPPDWRPGDEQQGFGRQQ